MDIETYVPTEKQRQFHSAPQRYKLYGGAMGGGKSVALCAEVIMLAIEYPKNVIYLARKRKKDLKRTTMLTFFEMLPSKLLKSYNKQDGLVRLVNGSEIILGDLQSTDKLKSLNLGAYAIDEASETTEDFFMMLNSRLRLHLPGIRRFGLLASNPEPCWLKDRFVIPQLEGRPLPNHIFIQSLTKENPHLPQDYVDSVYSDFPPVWRAKYLEGSWDVFDAQIFESKWLLPSEGNVEYAAKFMAVDPAISEDDSADETAIVTLGIDYDNIIHEVETLHGRWSFNAILENVISAYTRHKPSLVGVEYVAFQKALGDALRDKCLPIVALKADTDKIRRAIAVSNLFEQGRVRINTQALVRQLLEFPNGSHDDLVDALVYCLHLIRSTSDKHYQKKEDKYAGLDARSKQFWMEHFGEHPTISKDPFEGMF